MIKNKVKINYEKAEFLLIANPHSLFVRADHQFTDGNANIAISTSARNLGATFDNHMTMANHHRRPIRARLYYDGPSDTTHVFKMHRLLIPAGESHTILWWTKCATFLTECSHQGLPLEMCASKGVLTSLIMSLDRVFSILSVYDNSFLLEDNGWYLCKFLARH